jgi:hypothetical protein
MHVIESFSAGKYDNPDLCEDVIYAGEDFVAVIDGVTDRTYLDYDGLSGGRWAATTVAGVLAQLPENADLAEAEQRITATLAAGDHLLQPQAEEEAPAGAVMVCYSRARREIWRIGDCPFAIDGVANHGRLELSEIMQTTRWAYVSCLREAGLSDDEIIADTTDPTAPIQRVQHHFSNVDSDHPLAYGVLNGWPVPPRLREIIVVPEDAREVAMCSDGYPVLLPTLAESEDYLAADLTADPLRIGRHRSFRPVNKSTGRLSFDDRAFVRIAL